MRERLLLKNALPGVDLMAGPLALFTGAAWTGEENLHLNSLAARHAARELLRAARYPPAAIARRENGAPVFPPGLCGSLAHSAQACAAALSASARAVGVDLEPDVPLPADARDYALIPAERSGDALARFCAKECVHKALNPLSGAWLEFDEVEIALCAENGAQSFSVNPLSAAARAALTGCTLQGRVWRIQGHCLALLAVF